MEEVTGTVKAHGWSRQVLKILVRSVGISKDKEEIVI